MSVITIVIPINAVPNQVFTITLGSQQCTISIYQKSTGVFMDLSVNNTQLLCSRICEDRVGIVHGAYLGFIGQLMFIDQVGTNDPDYTGFNDRYILYYFSPSS